MPRHATSTSYKPGHVTWNRGKGRHILKPCPMCGKPIRQRHNHCRECSLQYRRANTESRVWKNGHVYKEHGSRPRPEHIVIAIKTLGRLLKKGECVHHINMKPDDNRNTNLLICNNIYHSWLHFQYARKFAERSFDYVPRTIGETA